MLDAETNKGPLEIEPATCRLVAAGPQPTAPQPTPLVLYSVYILSAAPSSSGPSGADLSTRIFFCSGIVYVCLQHFLANRNKTASIPCFRYISAVNRIYRGRKKVILKRVYFEFLLFSHNNCSYSFDFMFQLNAPFVYYIYQLPLHVSSNIVFIIRRIHCIHTASGSLYVTLKTIE